MKDRYTNDPKISSAKKRETTSLSSSMKSNSSSRAPSRLPSRPPSRTSSSTSGLIHETTRNAYPLTNNTRDVPVVKPDKVQPSSNENMVRLPTPIPLEAIPFLPNHSGEDQNGEVILKVPSSTANSGIIENGRPPSTHSMSSVVRMAQAAEAEKEKGRSFLSKLLKPRASKSQNNLPQYPESEPLHMIQGQPNISRVITNGIIGQNSAQGRPFSSEYSNAGEPAGVHKAGSQGRSQGPQSVQLEENSQFELYEEEPQSVSIPDVVNLVLDNRDKKGKLKLKTIEEGEIHKTTHIRYDAMEKDRLESAQNGTIPGNGKASDDADKSPGITRDLPSGKSSGRSRKTPSAQRRSAGSSKILKSAASAGSDGKGVPGETKDAIVTDADHQNNVKMSQVIQDAGIPTQNGDVTNDVKSDADSQITKIGDEVKENEGSTKLLSDKQTTPSIEKETKKDESGKTTPPNDENKQSSEIDKEKTPAKSDSRTTSSAVNRGKTNSGKSNREQALGNRSGKTRDGSATSSKKMGSSEVRDENKTFSNDDTKNVEHGESDIPPKKGSSDDNLDLIINLPPKEIPKDDPFVPPNTPCVLISSEKDVDDNVQVDKQTSNKNSLVVPSPVPGETNGIQGITAEATPSLNEGGMPRLQSPQVPNSPITLARKDSRIMEDLRSLRSVISTIDKDGSEEDKEKTGEREGGGGGGSSGVQRSRSLVAITAEENFLYVRGQTPSRSSSTLSLNREASTKGETKDNQSAPENHSQESQPQSGAKSANGKANGESKEQNNQSASNEQAAVDQSIPEDGAEGRMTEEKDSGGKASVEGTSGPDVAVSGETENDEEKDGEEKDANKVKENEKVDSKSESDKDISTTKDEKSSAEDARSASAPVSSNTKVPNTRGDVLVEALEESARSNAKDLADPALLPSSIDDSIMPYHIKPRGSSMSAVEVPEKPISTVSMSVANNMAAGSGTRMVGLGDQMRGGRSYFDRYDAPGSLWQRSQAPLEVKPSRDMYLREPREYEDYLPREPKRPVLQRRGSLGEIVMQAMQKARNDKYYDDDDDDAKWNARVRESRGAQTVRIKNQQPRHGILKTTDAKFNNMPLTRNDDLRPMGMEKPSLGKSDPIVIASGLVPENLQYLTSEYQAINGKPNGNGNGRYYNSGNHMGMGGNGYNNANNGTYSNVYNNAYNGNGYYSSVNNAYSNNVDNGVYGNNGTNAYNAYNINNNRTGIVTTTGNNRGYVAKEREQFQERYLDQSAPPAAITAPLVAPQHKKQPDDVFSRLHNNRKPERPAKNDTNATTTIATKKPDLPPKPTKTNNPASKTAAGKNLATTISSSVASKDPADVKGTLQASVKTATTGKAVVAAMNNKGLPPETNKRNQQNAGNDVFSRLYQNAPNNRKRSDRNADDGSRLLQVPEDHQPNDASIPGRRDAYKKSTGRGTNKGVVNSRKSVGDSVINMPLLAPDIVVDDIGGPTPVHGGHAGQGGGQSGDASKIPIVLLQGFFRGPGARSPHHRRPSVTVSDMALPPHLLDVTSMIRGALPVLPRSLAALCLTLNILLPGLGTMASGWLGVCCGRNRLAAVETGGTRMTSVLVTGVTGLVQLFTVTFFLVGWFWGVAWGILLVSISNRYASFCSEHRSSISGSVNLEMLTVNAS